MQVYVLRDYVQETEGDYALCKALANTGKRSLQRVAKMGLKGLKIGVLRSYYMTGFESVL